MATIKQIKAKIATFTTNLGKLKASAHEIGMMIFDHAQEHGDASMALHLVAALPNSWQPQMEAWFKAFSPIRVILKNKKSELSAEYKKAAKANQPEFWDREAALGTPFYELLDEPVVGKVYDFAALVALVAGLSKSIAKKIEDGKVPEEDIASAKTIAATIEGLNFSRVKAAVETDVGNDQDGQIEVEQAAPLQQVA